MSGGPNAHSRPLQKLDTSVKKPPIQMRVRDPSPLASLSTSLTFTDVKSLSRDRSASNLGGGLSNARQKQKTLQLGIPQLDFSNLKQVTDYKDWYAYS